MTAPTLRRELGLWSAMALVFGVVIGSAIFRVPAPVAAAAGTPGAILLVWVLGGVITLCGALSIAELAVRYPEAGGLYVYLREAWGRPLAFVYGWTSLVAAPMSTAAVALIFAEYLHVFVPLSAPLEHAAAALVVLVVAAANYRSVKLGAAIQGFSAATKLAAILGLAAAIFVLAPAPAGDSVAPLLPTRHAWLGVTTGLMVVLWAYQGWTTLTPVAGEVRQPQRNLPIALIGGVAVVMAVYLLINVAYLRVLPLARLVASPAVAADAATRVLGRAGSALVSALVLVSVLGTLNGAILSGPRVFYAMAEDGLFFRTVGRIHPRYRTPHVAVLLLAAITVAYVLAFRFVTLVEGAVLAVWPFLALCVLGLFRLRRTRPPVAHGYRTWGYPAVPALFALATLGIVAAAWYQRFWPTTASLALILAGVPVYLAWRAWQRRRATAG